MAKGLLTFSERLNNRLEERGIYKKWLAKKMEVTTVTISNKFKRDNFTVSERFYIKSILDMKN